MAPIIHPHPRSRCSSPSTGPGEILQFSAALFQNQAEFFDVSVVNETRNKTYERLARIAGSVGVDEQKVLALLLIPETPNSQDELNVGNQLTNDIKWMTKANRVVGVHVTPTIFFNGVEERGISSSFTAAQWGEWLAKNVV